MKFKQQQTLEKQENVKIWSIQNVLELGDEREASSQQIIRQNLVSSLSWVKSIPENISGRIFTRSNRVCIAQYRCLHQSCPTACFSCFKKTCKNQNTKIIILHNFCYPISRSNIMQCRPHACTVVSRVSGKIKNRLIDVENHKIKPRQLSLQLQRSGVELLVEWSCHSIKLFHTIISLLSKYCDHCRHASKRRQCGHSHLSCSQSVQLLSICKDKQ